MTLVDRDLFLRIDSINFLYERGIRQVQRFAGEPFVQRPEAARMPSHRPGPNEPRQFFDRVSSSSRH
jgi:hypothetical protein